MTNTRHTSRSLMLVLVGLVVGVTGALSVPLAHSVSSGVSGTLAGRQSASKAAGADAKVVACITRKKVIRSAGPFGGCPQGTSRKKVSVRGPRGKQGPGATGTFTKIPASATTFVALGAGMSVGCRTGANHIVLGLTTATSTSRGILIHDQGGNTTTVPWAATNTTRNSETFAIGEFTGRDAGTAPLEHVSIGVRWIGASSSCEIVAMGTPTG